MAELSPINPESYQTRVWQRYKDFSFAKEDVFVPIVGSEISAATLAMPLAFIKQNNTYVFVGLLSVIKGQNFFIGPSGQWLGAHVPSVYRCYPFSLMPGENGELTVYVDEASGLVHDDSRPGEDFYDAFGNLSQSLEAVVSYLKDLHRYQVKTTQAVSALVEVNGIESWPLTLKTEQGEQKIKGLFRINEKALNDLDDASFKKLRKAGALPIAYGQLFSMGMCSVFDGLKKMSARLSPPETTNQ